MKLHPGLAKWWIFPILIKTPPGRRGGLMFSVLVRGLSAPGPSPGWGHCVVFLGKTLLSQCLSPPSCINGYRQIYCDGLASHPGGSRDTLSHFMLRKLGYAPAWWVSWLVWYFELFCPLTKFPLQYIEGNLKIILCKDRKTPKRQK